MRVPSESSEFSNACSGTGQSHASHALTKVVGGPKDENADRNKQ